MHISKEEARIHNLINRFAKNEQLLNKELLSKDDLKNELFFREEDFQIAIGGNILGNKGSDFLPTDRLRSGVKQLLSNIIKNEEELDHLKKEYLLKFKELDESDSYRPTEELIDLASKIHWHILPEYEEYMIVNRGLYPNKDTEEYYNHFHTLEDLYRELTSCGKKIESKKGDMNLNEEIGKNLFKKMGRL